MPLKLKDPELINTELENNFMLEELSDTNKTQSQSNLQSDITSENEVAFINEDIVNSLVLNKDVIKKMVQTYRTNHATDANCLKFIHFNLREVIQLFIDNKVVDQTISIANQLNELQFYGFKIYLGNHFDDTTCPSYPNSPVPNPYLKKDTAILCNTQLDVATRMWKDQLSGSPSDTNSVTILGAGEGLDRGSLCPPNCPQAVDPDGYYHQDILP